MVLCPVPDHPATACMIWRQTRPGQSTYLGHVTHASGVQGTIMTCGYRITTRVKYGWRTGGHMPCWCLIRKTVTIAAWMYLFVDNKNMIKKKKKTKPSISCPHGRALMRIWEKTGRFITTSYVLQIIMTQICTCPCCITVTVTSYWPRRRPDYLLNHLFRRRSKKTSKLTPHKGRVMRQMVFN